MIRAYTLLLVLATLLVADLKAASANELEIGNGLVAIEEHRYDDAFKYFTNFLNDNSGNQVGLFYRSIAALGIGDKATALADINKAMNAKAGIMKKKEIKKDELLVQRGLVYLSMGQDNAAITDFSLALVVNPQNVNAYVSRGKAQALKKDLDASDNDYKQALALEETNLQANLGLAENMTSRSDYNGAIGLLSKLNTLYPKNNAIYTQRGDAYQIMGKYKEAFDDAMEQISFQEDYTKSMPLLSARAIQCDTYSLPKISQKVTSGENLDLWLQVRAHIYSQLDRYDEAIADYNKLEETLGEEFAPVCASRGNCYRSKGDYAKACEEYKKAIYLEENADAYANWSAVKYNEGKLDSALVLVNKAVNTDPTNATYYYLRGRIREAQKNSDQAQRDYEMGLQVDRKNSDLLYAHGSLLAERKKNGANDFQNICDNEKLPLPAHNRKPLALHQQGRNTEAVEWQNKVLAKFPTAANYYDAGLLYASMDMQPKAVEMLDKAFNQGFSDFGKLKYERELKNLGTTPEYAALLKKWAVADAKPNRKPASTKTDTTKNDLPVIPCTVDGMMLTFTTNSDTAKIFTISIMDVQMLLKYGYMQKNDVVSQRDKDKLDIMGIEPGSEVVLRTFKWGNKTLRNVTATIVEDPLAPILLTQGMLNEIDK